MFISDGKNPRVIPFTIGTGGCSRGDLLVLSGTTAVKAAAAPSAATILGIACGDYSASGAGQIELIDDHFITAAYTGTATPAIGTVYDLTDQKTVNTDDTTGGCFVCLSYDTVTKTMKGVIPESFKYI